MIKNRDKIVHGFVFTVKEGQQGSKFFYKFGDGFRIGSLQLSLSKRNGNAFCCMRDCIQSLETNCDHMRGYYIQIGRWGGDILWKSKRCYEKKIKLW